MQQDIIPVGCIMPIWKLYMLQFQLPPLGIWAGKVGPQMNKFEQVSSGHHQMSLVGGRSSGLMSGGVSYHVTYSVMHLMLPTPCPHGHTSVKTLPSSNFVCGFLKLFARIF